MERLTVFDGEFWVHKNFPPVGEDTVDEFVDCVKELAARLAAYEDTGLEPEEIEKIRKDVEDGFMKSTARRYGVPIARLRELAQADREGLVVLLPFPQHKTLFDMSDPRRPELLKDFRISATWTHCGIVFHSPWGIFMEHIERGYIKQASEEEKKALGGGGDD